VGALRASELVIVLSFVVATVDCYHFSFEQRAPAAPNQPVPAQPNPDDEITYRERVATYLNGFVGTGRVESYKYCQHPIRTELRVTGLDVLFGFFTLLIYTPHTLYVTCLRNEAPPRNARSSDPVSPSEETE
jgi:hypothetical protein